MKPNKKITIILLSMFLLTQLIGLYVINADPFNLKVNIGDTEISKPNPVLSWIRPPEIQEKSDFSLYFGSTIFSFIFAVLLFFLLIKFKVDKVIKIWFFIVVSIALSISFIALSPKYIYLEISLIFIALILSFIKIFRGSFIIHNLTEIFVYPGMATIFVPILNFYSIIILLVIISVYDIWAVWHSGIMQKMAKYQINNLKIFPGFFIPYLSKKERLRIKRLKLQKRNKNKKIKANIAILGGGDVAFPLIAAGVLLKTKAVSLPFNLFPNFAFNGGILPALFVVVGATMGLSLLFAYSEKKKFYPAMPFITAGIFVGLILSQLF